MLTNQPFQPCSVRDAKKKIQVVFFLLGALTIVEIMDAHKGACFELLSFHRLTEGGFFLFGKKHVTVFEVRFDSQKNAWHFLQFFFVGG